MTILDLARRKDASTIGIWLTDRAFDNFGFSVSFPEWGSFKLHNAM